MRNFIKNWFGWSMFEKVNFIVTCFVKLTLLVAIPFSVYEKNWIALFVTVLTLILILFLPNLLKRRYRVSLPTEFQLIIVVFLYSSLFLGMVREWYARFWWWDSLMHGFSGVALGFSGFLILYILYKTERLKASPFLTVLFAFCFAVALGALWEIFEFGVDHFFGEDMQRARFTIEKIEEYGSSRIAIYDTMWDMMLNTMGALIASVAGFFYLKKGEVPILKKFVQKFEEKNPDLFHKNQ